MQTTSSASPLRSASASNYGRYVNIVLGVWLFISAFAWRHSAEQMTNTWIVGVLSVVFALVALYVNSQARYLNTLLSIWLFISALALPSISSATIWNNVIVAIVMFAFSVLTRGEGVRREGGGAFIPRTT
jgi:hypothetical protein